MRKRVSEMTNHVAKASGIGAIPQGDRVVCETEKNPVCLDAIPGAHKHFGETEMLFDILVKELDREAFGVKTHHFEFGHIEVVGNKESAFSSFELGDKDQRRSYSREKGLFFGDLKSFLFGAADGLVFPRSLCQVTRRNLFAVHEKESISFDRTKESPASFLNRIQNGRTRIPGIHHHGQSSGKKVERLFEDFSGQLDFAFESFGSTVFLGLVPPNRPAQALGACLENGRHSTQPPDGPMNTMVKTGAFDMLAVSGARGVVQNHDCFFGLYGFGQLSLIVFPQALGRLCRMLNEMMKSLRVSVQLRGDFPNRTELHKPDQTCEVNQEVTPLRFAQNLQELTQIGRNLFRAFLAHGFRALLAVAGIGDFGRKPFYLRSSTASLYLKDLSFLIT